MATAASTALWNSAWLSQMRPMTEAFVTRIPEVAATRSKTRLKVSCSAPVPSPSSRSTSRPASMSSARSSARVRRRGGAGIGPDAPLAVIAPTDASPSECRSGCAGAALHVVTADLPWDDFQELGPCRPNSRATPPGDGHGQRTLRSLGFRASPADAGRARRLPCGPVRLRPGIEGMHDLRRHRRRRGRAE